MRWILCLASALGVAASCLAADPLPRATPESVGMSSQRLARLGRAIQEEIDSGRIPGAVVAVARDGKLVYFEALGYRDKAAGVPMTTDTIFAIASMTKPMVAVGAMVLQEENRLHANDSVGKYLPVLDKMSVISGKAQDATLPFKTVPAVRKVTIQDLMRHTAGMTYGNRGTGELFKAWPQSGITSAEQMTGPEFLERIASLPLHYQPGTKWDYSLGFDVLGLAMEAAARQPLGAFLEDRIFKPLDMRDTTFILPREKWPRLAKPLPINPETGRPPSTYDATKPAKFNCGGGCLVTTAGDYLRFYQMVLDRGKLGSTRIVSRKSIEYMTSNQLGPEVDVEALHNYPNINGYGFGLGVAVRLGYGVAGVMGSPGDFHWHGATGSNGWVDPKERLIVLFFAQTPGPIRFENRQVINALALQAIDD